MDTGIEEKKVARKYLRLLLGALVLWDARDVMGDVGNILPCLRIASSELR
ncbi:MAG: hypothetical protein HWN69_10475 [Desulfobacterales bacterium]|nr:hypothetical protein [Desulfobacterales bacterium]